MFAGVFGDGVSNDEFDRWKRVEQCQTLYIEKL